MTKPVCVSLVSEKRVNPALYCPEKSISLEFLQELGADWKESSANIAIFKREFPILWRYRERICHTPELSNIQTRGLGCSYAYVNLGPVTLGVLLNLYGRGELRVGHCRVCGHETLGYYFCGSILSGVGSHYGFCPECGVDDPHQGKGHGYVHRVFLGYEHAFPVDETMWTISALVAALKKRG